MTRWGAAAALVTVLALLLAPGCGDEGVGGSDSASGGDEAGDESAAPVPEVPDPAEPQPCDGVDVLCVDASVGGDGGTEVSPFSTIGAAVEALPTGGTIQVAAGTYDEAVLLSGQDGVSIVGGFPAGGDFSERDAEANQTTVQGTADAAVVAVEASTGVSIEGLHLTGGGGYDDGSTRNGGGVYVDVSSSGVSIIGNLVEGNDAEGVGDPTATVGGGIAPVGTDVTIAGNLVEANTAGRGSGIAALGETSTVSDNTVRGNTSVGDHGGGVYVAGEVAVVGNLIEGNSVGEDLGYGWGGGLIAFGDDTTATLQQNVITGNTAPSAGSGAFIDDGADATLTDELYYDNECTVDGGVGLFADSGGETPTVVEADHITVAEHDCPDSPNGGNAVLGVVSEEGAAPPEVTITDSILWGNAALDVQSLGATIDISGSIVEQAPEGDGITADGTTGDDPGFADPASGDFSNDTGLGAQGT